MQARAPSFLHDAKEFALPLDVYCRLFDVGNMVYYLQPEVLKECVNWCMTMHQRELFADRFRSKKANEEFAERFRFGVLLERVN